jgi:hypothetical protein
MLAICLSRKCLQTWTFDHGKGERLNRTRCPRCGCKGVRINRKLYYKLLDMFPNVNFGMKEEPVPGSQLTTLK